ncbi:MAG TPA: nuclear transport factor 2 family protein [Vicinamibacterales bacterium]
MMDVTNPLALDVQRAIARLMHAIDLRRWADVANVLAAEVTTDYTSLFGGEVQRQRRDDLVAGWRTLLTPLDATQHLLGPIDVRPSDQGAAASCHVRGYHVRKGAPGGDEWMVAGHYDFALSQADGAWRITAITLHTLYQTGNRAVLQQTASAGR